MRVLPVLDLLEGVVVRGVAGRRHEYRPIKSVLTGSAEPLHVARAFRDRFGLDQLYVADLDAIAGKPPALGVLGGLLRDGFRLWVDAGLGPQRQHCQALADAGVTSIIVGLESLEAPADLDVLVQMHGPAHIVFSLDMKHGRPLGRAWPEASPWAIAEHAIAAGNTRILALDLAGVGMGEGLRTLTLCRRLRAAHPHLELTTGGGVRGPEDLLVLKEAGIDFVLIASALHDGAIEPEHLAKIGSG